MEETENFLSGLQVVEDTAKIRFEAPGYFEIETSSVNAELLGLTEVEMDGIVKLGFAVIVVEGDPEHGYTAPLEPTDLTYILASDVTLDITFPDEEIAISVTILAEDTLVNQEVAVGMLESVGCRVDVVANGLEAMEAVSAMSYDVIFMDCQMPEMDGYEATRNIRKKEEKKLKAQSSKEEVGSQASSSRRASGKRIPIIALTAHAMEGDRKQCLAAGMDDYLRKPFDVNKLSTILERWLPAARVVQDISGVTEEDARAPLDS